MKRAFLGLTFLILLWAALWFLGADKVLTLNYLKLHQSDIQMFYDLYPWTLIASFSAVYIFLTAISFPAASLLSVLAGSLFGVFYGTIIVSICATVGAIIAFWLCRVSFYSSVVARFAKTIDEINQKVEREGSYYLFLLRLNPIVPFFVINIAMGLTNMRLWTFTWVSWLGMIPGTYLYANAGKQLSEIESLWGLLDWKVVASLTALGAFPLVMKRLFRHRT